MMKDGYEEGFKYALKRINEPINVIIEDWEPSMCPRCKTYNSFNETASDGYYNRAYSERCPHCGQKLKWKE